MLKGKAYCLFLLLLPAACGVEADGTVPVDTTPYFEVEAYFNREIARLDSIQPSLQKKVVVDGQSEEHSIESTDFGQELQIFRRSDINRPAWFDKYEVDSIRENGQLQAVQYTALDTSLNTRLLSISFQEGEVNEILIRNRSRSAIASTEQDLRYRPGRSYRIESKQKTIGSDAREVLVEVAIKE